LQGGEHMIYITGDTHGEFRNVERFCKKMQTSKDDVLIILGDAGINYYGPEQDKRKKKYLESLPITIFAIHGNHEMRPQTIPTYHETDWNGGKVYVEDDYPHILFAKDAELYELNGLLTFVVGGAYSVDKNYRLLRGLAWWPDEQPSDEIKRKAEEKLEEIDWEVDAVLTHTAPLKYEPTEVFLPMIDQSTVDKSTEQWLDRIEDQLYYDRWYCGHYHTAKKIDKIQFMYNDFDEFPSKDEENLKDDFEQCDECDVNGDNYYLDEEGELGCRCMDSPFNPINYDEM